MMQGIPEIPDPTKQTTKTKDFFYFAVRAPCGQPKPFHQSNKFFRHGKPPMNCSTPSSTDCRTLSACFAKRVGNRASAP
jgi:hypothetical protein